MTMQRWKASNRLARPIKEKNPKIAQFNLATCGAPYLADCRHPIEVEIHTVKRTRSRKVEACR